MGDKLTHDYAAISSVRERLQSKQREYALHELGDWVVETCLLFGASATTAYKVAALMVEGIDREGPR